MSSMTRLNRLFAARPADALRLFALTIPVALGSWGVLDSLAQAAEVTGEGVYKYCVDCHGKYGHGGEAGRYPRIAGLPQPYIDDQLHAFKSQTRVNKPMIPIFKHVRFDEDVIDVVSTYIASMSVPDLGLWPYEADPDALASFASREDYAEAGQQAYSAQCAGCHGDAGQGGEAGAPPLVAQYPAYLRKQMQDFAAGAREQRPDMSCGVSDAAKADAIVNHLVDLGR